jgi:diguanylate cyclase
VSAPQGTTALPPAQLAKAALRRLAEARLEPTPENYARAYAEESGQPASTLPPRALEQLDRIAARLCDDTPTR